ncbi:hypothetical protein TAMA11512_05950 [Selenomonas sp. TAMA-11512]|nr:hypothetical protein TAMA11512_05950 [Selenomonas sp. TAMA-11512]
MPPGCRAADIGTDHAYLSIALAAAGQVTRMIAADKNEGPLEAAKRTVAEAGFEGRIELRLGDGLAVLRPGEVDTVILAGMGGELMAAILRARPEVVADLRTLILQPMADGEELRRCIYESGWHIDCEALAEADGRIYEILRAVPGREKMPSAIELCLGPCILRERPPLLQAHIDAHLERLERIRRGMEASERAAASERYGEILERIQALEARRQRMRVSDIMGIMESFAPKRLAEEWDNPGLLVGSPAKEVRKVYVTLDITEELIEEAVREEVDMIVAHHPLLFRAVKSIRTDQPLGRMLQKLLAADIAVFAAHTNLDAAVGGVNDVLAERLGLRNVVPLQPQEEEGTGLGRMGELSETLSERDFIARVKASLGVASLRLAGGSNPARRIRKVAVCGGSGAEFIRRAVFLGADAYVTGDVKYHDGQLAKENDILVLDAGHKPTEELMVGPLADRIRKGIKETENITVTAKIRTDDWLITV